MPQRSRSKTDGEEGSSSRGGDGEDHPDRLAYPPAKTQREKLLARIDALVATSEHARDAAAEAVRVVGELLRAALLPVEEGPPRRLRLAAMKADEVRNQLPCPGIGRMRVCSECGLERCLARRHVPHDVLQHHDCIVDDEPD